PAGRFSRRLNLLHALEHSGFEKTGGADRVKDHTALYRQTAHMVLSPRMRAFELGDESPKMCAAYGDSACGQGCLLAGRLVQPGVTFVEVRSSGWDTHQQSAEKVAQNASTVDPGFAALVADLKAKGMLEKPLVVWMGEFGRTPKINPNA